MPITAAKWISFRNQKYRKVVGGKYTVLIHFVNVSAPNPTIVVLWNPFKWEILKFISIENLVVCVPSTVAKWISFRNQRHRKVVGGKQNILVHYWDVSAPGPSVVVLCNSFIWDILWFIFDQKSCCLGPCHNSKMNIIQQPEVQKSCRRQTQCCHTLFGC